MVLSSHNLQNGLLKNGQEVNACLQSRINKDNMLLLYFWSLNATFKTLQKGYVPTIFVIVTTYYMLASVRWLDCNLVVLVQRIFRT